MPPISRRLRLFTLAALLALGGCNSFRGAPPSSAPDFAAAGASWSKLSDANTIANCIAAPEAEQKSCRNSIVQARLITIDNNYTTFRQDFYREARAGGFAATIVSLALNTTGAIGGVTSATKSILSGVAGAVTGGRAAFDKEMLIEQTATAVERAMDGARAKVLARIIPSLGKSPTDYPLMVALNDLEAYFNAGTLLGGLMELGDAVNQKADAAEAKVATIRGINESSAAEFLSRFLNRQSVLGQIPSAKLIDQAILEVVPKGTYGGGNPVGWFRNPGTPADQISAVARKLGWTGTD